MIDSVPLLNIKAITRFVFLRISRSSFSFDQHFLITSLHPLWGVGNTQNVCWHAVHDMTVSVSQYGDSCFSSYFLLCLLLHVIWGLWTKKCVLYILSLPLFILKTATSQFKRNSFLLRTIYFHYPLTVGNTLAVLWLKLQCCSLFSGTQWVLNREGNRISLALIKGFTVHFIVLACFYKIVWKHDRQQQWYHSNRSDLCKRTKSRVSYKVMQHITEHRR